MTNDALIKEAREQLEAWNYKGHLDDWRGAESGLCSVIKRLADALTAANAREAALRTELELVNDLRNRASEALEALRKEAAEAIEAIAIRAFQQGFAARDRSTLANFNLCVEAWKESEARCATQRIGGAE